MRHKCARLTSLFIVAVMSFCFSNRDATSDFRLEYTKIDTDNKMFSRSNFSKTEESVFKTEQSALITHLRSSNTSKSSETRKLASGTALPVLSYAMNNGDTGYWSYWDANYKGSGSKTTDGAFLSGGTGALTDGVIATKHYDSVSNYAGTGPYVGWSFGKTPNPLITFYFSGNPTISSILIAVDNPGGSTSGSVCAPSAIKVDDVTIPFAPPASGTFGTIALSGLTLGGYSHTVQLFNTGITWIFVSEISFYGTALPVLSYAMNNGDTGYWPYWDANYKGSGSKTTDGAVLSGGTGALTDGVIATKHAGSVSNYAGTGSYVGWSFGKTPNPLITFYFSGNPTISSILIAVDNPGGSTPGDICAPSAIKVDDVAIPFAPLASGTSGTIALSGLTLGGNSHTVQLFNTGSTWIFVSEISFYGNSGYLTLKPSMKPTLKSTVCSRNCAACSSSSSCLQCISANLYKGSCVDTCPTGYYASSGTCSACYSNCDTCSSYFYCTSCSSSYLYNGLCYKSCPSGTYETGGKCFACSQNCDSCTSAFSCFQCSTGFLYDGNCVNTCPGGYYADSAVCSACSRNCAACTSASSCSQCLPGFLYAGSCVDTCPTGYYAASGACSACAKGCASCRSTTVCTGCTSGYYLSGSTCGLTCPRGTYKSGSTCVSTCPSGTYMTESTCAACAMGCDSCSSSTVCVACSSGYYFSQSTCAACPSNCMTCTSSTSCSQCSSAYYLSFGFCSECSTGCSSCTSAFTCTACSAGYLYFGACYISCPSGTFISGSTCAACSSSCMTCTSSSSCSQCISAYYLSSGFCSACSNGCLSCTGASTCMACSTGYLFLGACTISCPSGTFIYGSTCAACPSNCATCTSSSTCSQCNSGYILSSGTCSGVQASKSSAWHANPYCIAELLGLVLTSISLLV